jgi:hypothetical protein
MEKVLAMAMAADQNIAVVLVLAPQNRTPADLRF